MLSTGLLAAMRAMQAGALPDTCTIQKATAGVGTAGSPTTTYTTRTSGVACRLALNRQDERTLGQRNTVVGDWVLTMAYNQAIEASDRVVVGTRTFEVASVNTGESWETATRVGLMEVVA